MTRKTLITFLSVFMAASLPLTTAAQAGKKTAIGLGILGAAVVLGAAANASKNNQRKAQARARAKAKARARAQAKQRAIAAQKRKAAQQRAYAAKKKQAAQKRAIAARKKEAAQQRAYAAKQAKQQKIAATEEKARAEAEAQAKIDAEKTEGAFVDAPSTAALLTSQDVASDTSATKSTGDATEVAVADELAKDSSVSAPVVENSGTGEGNCKRFIPAVGLTVSVGC